MTEQKRTFILSVISLLLFIQVHGQSYLPVFTQYGECFINAGHCNDVKVRDTLAFVGSEAGLLIFNIKDPDHPVFLDCFYTNKLVFKVFVTDSLAFVTYYSISACDLSILDITDVNNPAEINSFELPNGFENFSIYVQNNYLFLGMDGGFNIFDISNLFEPQLIYYGSEIDPHDMVVREDFVYMVANYRYFAIMDISTINEPELLCWIGDYTISRSSISLQGNFAYVAGNTLDIFDISSPSNPSLLCAMETNYLYDIEVDGISGFTLSEDSLFVLDISNSGSPVIVDSCLFSGNALDGEDGALVSSIKYCAPDIPYGIAFFKLDDSWQISFSSIFITDKARDVSNYGNYAFISNGYSGLNIIDISTPSNPVSAASCLKGHYVAETIVDEGIAWVRTFDGLKIVDISNPEMPVPLGSYYLPATLYMDVFSIEKYHHYVYLGGNLTNQITIINVTDLNNPTLAGQFVVNDWSPDIEIFKENLYVAGYWGGMQIFDLVVPENPQLISEYPMGMASKIEAGENAAFVAGGLTYPGGIVIFNLSNINVPEPTMTYPSGCTDFQYFDKYLFVGRRDYQDLNSSILILNMNDLNDPQEIQEISDVAPNGVFFNNDRIYVAEDFTFKIFGDSLTVSNHEKPDIKPEIKLTCSPNPFTDMIKIQFHVNVSGKVRLSIYNTYGERIALLFNTFAEQGLHVLDWDGRNNPGMKIPPGLYLIELQTKTSRITEKLIITGN